MHGPLLRALYIDNRVPQLWIVSINLWSIFLFSPVRSLRRSGPLTDCTSDKDEIDLGRYLYIGLAASVHHDLVCSMSTVAYDQQDRD